MEKNRHKRNEFPMFMFTKRIFLTNNFVSGSFCCGNILYLNPITANRWHSSGGQSRTNGIKQLS